MTDTSTHKTLVRGNTALFEAIFVESDGTPVVPIDTSMYPSISIYTPDEVITQTGIATNAGDGRWRYFWNVPADAQLSTQTHHWRIEWNLLTAGNRQIQYSQSFDVIDHIEATPSERAYTQITLEGQSERVLIKFRRPQEDVKLFLQGGSETVELTSRIKDIESDGFYHYYADTDALSYGCFLVTWRAMETLTSPWQTYIQQIRVPEDIFWLLQPDLRMLIDKVQKKDGHVQSYSDSDMYGYLLRGTDIINSVDPISSWSLLNFPAAYGFYTFLILASAWWGLQAQYLSEGELQMNFSGQTVTLDVDRTGIYDAAISRIRAYLDETLPKTKRNMIRVSNVGSLASRPYDFGLSSLVARVQTVQGGANQILPLMSRLGLL